MAVFIPNPTGIAAIALSAGVQAALEGICELVADAARNSSPELTGDYVDSIEVEDGDLPGSKRVVAKDFKAGWIEFGTEDTPAFAPLTTGAESVGLVIVKGES